MKWHVRPYGPYTYRKQQNTHSSQAYKEYSSGQATGQVLKINLRKLKLYRVFPNDHGIKLEINCKKKIGKFTNCGD